MRFPLSIIVLTKNEEMNIGSCLSRLDWADDVILLDSGSADQTVDRARQARPDIRVFDHTFQDFGDQRNWALDHAGPRHPWVLFLDADEHCNEACAAAVRRAVQAPGTCVGFYLTCRNMFLGRWIRRCTFYPSWQMRLLRLDAVRFRKEGHGQREVTEGPTGYIQEPYDHFALSKGVKEWIARHNEYSSNEVGLIRRLRSEPPDWRAFCGGDPVRRRRTLKQLAARCPMLLRPGLRFFYTYLLRGGFLDGRAGLLFCLLRLAHELHMPIKYHEAEYLSVKDRA